MNKLNIFDNLPIDKSSEQFTELSKKEDIRIERIVSNGQKSKKDFWYDQDENEFVMVLEGHAIIEFEDKEIVLHKGDYIDIKAHRKHRVKYTSEKESTIWLAVFYKS